MTNKNQLFDFKAGDTVTWVSQATGGHTRKTGTVVAVVPAGANPRVSELASKFNARSAYGGGVARSHQSYVVSVPQGTTGKARPVLYWPVVSLLARA